MQNENAELRARLQEAEDFIEAIRTGEVEALVIGEQVYHLESAESASNRFRGDVLEQVSDIVIAVDNDERLVYLNPAAERKYGMSGADILGRKLQDLYKIRWANDEQRQAAQDYIESQGSWRGENVHITSDGSEFHAESTIGRMYDADHRCTGRLAVIRDVTSRKRAEEDLRIAHEELESRVIDRTRELAESNAALQREMEERSRLERQRTELLERIVTSEEEERGRIARDIHDQLGQRVTAIRLQIANMVENKPDPEKLAGQVRMLQRTALRLDSEISFLAWELRPAALDDLGLPEAAAAFLEDWSHNYKISSDFDLQGFTERRLQPQVETQLYRIMQEALNNIAKHSKASRANVLLSWIRDEVSLVVEDNGAGFDLQAAEGRRSGRNGFGLVSMQERASLVGGKIEIESRPGAGTTIYARVPATTS